MELSDTVTLTVQEIEILLSLLEGSKDQEQIYLYLKLEEVCCRLGIPDVFCEDCWDNDRFMNEKTCFSGQEENKCCFYCYKKNCSHRCPKAVEFFKKAGIDF